MPDDSAKDKLRFRDLAQHVRQVTSVNGMPVIWYWKGRFWIWSEGVYEPQHLEDTVLFVLKHLMSAGIDSSHWVATQVAHALAAMSMLFIEKYPCWITTQGKERDGPYSIALANKLVDINALALDREARPERPVVSSHDPAWFSTTRLPYAWDPDCQAPLALKLFRENLTGPEAVAMLRGFMGYFLLPTTREHKALFLYGKRGTGKSAIANTVRVLLGKRNFSQLSISQFGNRFAMPRTEGMMLNITDEVCSVISAQAEERLKWFMSGSSMDIEDKNVRMYAMDPTAKLLVCLNEYPRFHDTEGAIWRRICPLRCPNKVSDEKKDTRLYDEREGGKLVGEGPGIFNFAIRGLGEYLKAGRLLICQDSEREWATASAENCGVRTFVTENLRSEPDGYVSSKNLRELYEHWCDQNGVDRRERVGVVPLGRVVRREFSGASSKSRRLAGMTVNGFTGVTLI
ncbi:hypothetical protein LCGC14_0901890 [marine sediment metagenome]|uniref:SF3 helicase domain-containing protein n=1 Tax=marine sediment metagenome TaxID=412755 RepID=A0A0F9NW54_9ZZZZ